jgi:hypothetical protein
MEKPSQKRKISEDNEKSKKQNVPKPNFFDEIKKNTDFFCTVKDASSFAILTNCTSKFGQVLFDINANGIQGDYVNSAHTAIMRVEINRNAFACFEKSASNHRVWLNRESVPKIFKVNKDGAGKVLTMYLIRNKFTFCFAPEGKMTSFHFF